MGILTTAAAVLVLLVGWHVGAQAQARTDSGQNAIRPPLPIGSVQTSPVMLIRSPTSQSLPAEDTSRARSAKDCPHSFDDN